MRTLWIFLGLGLAAAVAGCATFHDSGSAQNQQDAYAKIDKENCRAHGGKIRKVCMSQMPVCIVPYADGGRDCTDNAQCQGRCLYAGPRIPLERGTVAGKCQVDDDPCGCRTEVVNGRIDDTLCVD